MSKRYKKRALAITVLIALVILAACVFAANWSDKSVVNSFNPATVDVAIVENGSVVSGRTNTISLSGGSAAKQVEIQNSATGTNPADEYVRVRIFPKFVNEADTDIELFIPYNGVSNISGNSFKLGDVTFTLAEGWSDNWEYVDGCFYYKSALAPEDKTAPLLKSVSIDDDKAEYYKSLGAMLRVSVLADAIQTVGGAVESRWGNGTTLRSADKPRPTEAESQEVLEAISLFSATPVDATTSPDSIVTEYRLEQARRMITSVFIAEYTLTDKEESKELDEELAEEQGDSLFEEVVDGVADVDNGESDSIDSEDDGATVDGSGLRS